MEYTPTPTIFLDADIELAIKRAVRNQRRRSAVKKSSKTSVSRRGKAPKIEMIMNDPAILNA